LLSKIELETYNLHLWLAKSYPEEEIHNQNNWQNKYNYILQVNKHKIDKKRSRLNKKFRNLKQNQTPREDIKIQNIDGMVSNLSSNAINEKENEFLNRGLNFAIESKKIPIEDIIADVETGIKFLPANTKSEIRNEIKQVIKKTNINNKKTNNRSVNYEKEIKSLKEKDIVFIKADKNNSFVLMDKPDYDSKITQMLNEGPYTRIDESPLAKQQEKAIGLIHEAEKVLNNPILKYTLRNSNPRLPIIYSTIKTHKINKDMRPIISCINSPYHKIAQWLIQQFKKIPRPIGLDVKNTFEFKDKIKDIVLKRTEKMVSFDVTSLYTNVPRDKALECLENWLMKNKVPPDLLNLYLNMTKLCINDTSFQFREHFYKQNSGLAMGNPLSSFLANIYMIYFENEVSKEKWFPRIWIRYVDDIFAIVHHRNINKILNKLNSIENSIKFTSETETDNKIYFLEVTLERTEINTIELDIFRKPTFLPRYITSDSYHCQSHKIAAFNNMVFRMLNLNLKKEKIEKEKQNIFEIASINGYPKDIIMKLIKKQEYKLFKKQNTALTPLNNTQKVKTVAITYCHHINNKLKNVLNWHKIDLASKNSSKTKNILSNYKDRKPKLEGSGIYAINCNNCPMKYIGQTRRSFKTRFLEHLKYTMKKEINISSVARHMVELNHKFSINNHEILRMVNDPKKLDAYESMEIQKINQSLLMNTDRGPINSSLFSLIL
jgi:hypothetical protein